MQEGVPRHFRVILGGRSADQRSSLGGPENRFQTLLWIYEALDSYGLDSAELARRCSFPALQGDEERHLAVSGGQDSLALVVLALLCGQQPVAHHVDHGLRPGSDREAEHVERELSKLSVELRRHRVEVRSGPNLEERARAARFGVLPVGISTGHTVDDQAETVLINLLRGTSSAGIAAMRPGATHPILGIRRSETAMICRALDLVPIDDQSNRDLSFLRNRIRHEVIPLLCDVAKRDVTPLLARTAAQVRSDIDLVDALIGERSISTVAELRAMDERLARRLLREKIGAVSSLVLSSFHAQRALDVGLSRIRSTSLPNGYSLTMERDGLVLRNAHGQVLWSCR